MIIIASISENGCIGNNNKLLWKQQDDLKRFKNLTTDNVVIMGRKTYESLPFKPLKDRINIVISKNTFNLKDCVLTTSIEETLNLIKDKYSDKLSYIIGGGEIYKSFLSYCDKMYITLIHNTFDGDTYFPNIDNNYWEKIKDEYHKKDQFNEYDYSYQIYIKNNKNYELN